MRHCVFVILSVLLFCAAILPAIGSDFDWESYSYEELTVISEDLEKVLSEKRREWAIANGNRVIELDIPDVTLYTTKTQLLTPTVTRVVEDAPETTSFVWTSSDDSIARVSANGTITAVGLGDAEIICTAKDDEYIFTSAVVHVILPVNTVAVSEPKVTLLISDDPATAEAVLSAVIKPEEAFCKDVSWTSSNEDVVTVDENGLLTAKAPGTATITATSLDEFSAAYPKRATSAVTVLQAVGSVEVDQTDVVMNKNAYVTLKAGIEPANASVKTLTWESSDPNVVRVTNGQLFGVSCGNAVITCTAADGSGASAKANVTVIQMVNSVQIPGIVGTLELLRDEEKLIEAKVGPEDATDKSLNWTSSDDSIVEVDADGKVRAVGCGPAVITASAADGSGRSAFFNVYVPTISFPDKTVTVTDRAGMDIPFKFYGDPKSFVVKPTSTPTYSMSQSWDPATNTMTLKVIPSMAGTATVYLVDPNDQKSSKSFNLTIDHSAAYDLTSFPKVRYSDAQRYPEKYDGSNISIYGKVVQKIVDGNHITLRVATSWGWEDVFYVTYRASDINVSVIEDDWITVYGRSTGSETYTALWGNEITIPSMTAERIFMGTH